MLKIKPKISVCIPLYNGQSTIGEAIESILAQTYKNFEILVIDDCSPDKSVLEAKKFTDKRVRVIVNKKNIGCGANLSKCQEQARADIVFYVCGDDVLVDKNALEKIVKVFRNNKDVGMVTRPYYWFQESVYKPVRLTRQFNKNQVVSIRSDYKKITDVIALSDQISGIALKKNLIDRPFSGHSFIEMASIVLPILKKHKVIILKDNIIGVRIGNNGASSPRVYVDSPMMVWHELIQEIFSESKYKKLRQYLNDNFVANNYIGLVQIKNYATWRQLFREIYFLLKLRPANFLIPKFWFFALGTILVPRSLLRQMVLLYKNKINYKFINV